MVGVELCAGDLLGLLGCPGLWELGELEGPGVFFEAAEHEGLFVGREEVLLVVGQAHCAEGAEGLVGPAVPEVDADGGGLLLEVGQVQLRSGRLHNLLGSVFVNLPELDAVGVGGEQSSVLALVGQPENMLELGGCVGVLEGVEILLVGFEFVVVVVLLAGCPLLRRLEQNQPPCPVAQRQQSSRWIETQGSDVVLL